eukprot:567285-Rhodomonas_salina.1
MPHETAKQASLPVMAAALTSTEAFAVKRKGSGARKIADCSRTEELNSSGAAASGKRRGKAAGPASTNAQGRTVTALSTARGSAYAKPKEASILAGNAKAAQTELQGGAGLGPS